jgi:hypothetical protein
MYKKIICIGLLNVTTMYGITLGPNLLDNSPSDYLLDLEKSFNDPEATRQIGDELCERNYIYINNISIYDQIAGRFDERPATPEYGYTSNEGMWVWVADSVGSETGTWCWVLKTISYYIAFFSHYGIPT